MDAVLIGPKRPRARRRPPPDALRHRARDRHSYRPFSPDPGGARAFWAAGASRGLANRTVCCGHAPACRPKCPASKQRPYQGQALNERYELKRIRGSAGLKPASFIPTSLHAENLVCRRGGRLIFEGLSFVLRSGEAIALTGRNGAGKSSLIAMLCGRLRPDGGQIRLEGGEDEAELAEISHLVGHRDGLKTALTARENLRFSGEL